MQCLVHDRSLVWKKKQKTALKGIWKSIGENPKYELGISYQGIIAKFLRCDNGIRR